MNLEELIKKYKKAWNKYGMGSVISYSEVVSDLEKLALKQGKNFDTLPIVSVSEGIERRELLKGNYRQHFLDWKTKYFRYKPKTYEYTSKDGKREYTLDGLHKMYKRAMNESPFNGG